MVFDQAHLEALAATVDAGTLEGAARTLSLTPSAVSQRLSALERSCGRVLLERTRPVRVTGSGAVLLRLARQVGQLTADAAAEIGLGGAGAASPPLPLAVNVDSLATWILPALAPLARGDGDVPPICLEVHREDEQRTVELLRAGTVMAAVAARAEPVPGCAVTPLGALRYRPLASPAFVGRWLPDGPTTTALENAVLVIFDEDDDLQHQYLRRRGVDPHRPPRQTVPGSAEFLTAVRLGMGWGMLPDLNSAAARRNGELVVVDSTGVIDVTLYWHQWKRAPAALDRVRAAVVAAAQTSLHQIIPPGDQVTSRAGVPLPER